jgi:transcriptional regulator with PAS, ATPase and Fis domain
LAETSLDSEDLLEVVSEPTMSGVVVVDNAQRILLTNQRFDDMLEMPGGTAVGRPGAEVLSCTGLSASGRRCSAGNLCIACRAWKMVGKAFRQKREQRSCVGVEVEARDTVHVVEVGLRAAVLRMGGESCAMLVLEGLDRLNDSRRWADEGGMHGILGADPKMFELFETIRRVARVEVPILIQGESGSGKELVATALHKESGRKGGRLVPVNCGALSWGLLESELFGHVKGAFTGALRDKKGRFELAQGGTIFLDEIAELSPEIQIKLLRVLQDGTFERVGGEETVRSDARVICATNQDLELAVSTRRFRADLFYRLCVVLVTVPPLRERLGDITLLVEHLLGKAAREYAREVPELSPELNDVLLRYPWPGNVRELENAMRHTLIRSRGSGLRAEHLPRTIVEQAGRRPVLRARKRKLDNATVARALREAEGNKAHAARLLGISRATLYRFLAERKRNLPLSETSP